MKLSEQSQLQIDSAIRKVVGKYERSHEQASITDIYIQPNPSSGELCFFDDNDHKLTQVVIPEWVSYAKENFYESVEQILRNALNKANHSDVFARLNILKPYSFVLIDDDKETISELLLIDDDTLLVDGSLLKGLDEELDAFLKDLLEN